jgi:hypothetical protein
MFLVYKYLPSSHLCFALSYMFIAKLLVIKLHTHTRTFTHTFESST